MNNQLCVTDPWVIKYNTLKGELQKVGIPEKLLGAEKPDWSIIRSNIKHYCAGRKYQIIMKLFNDVHKNGG